MPVPADPLRAGPLAVPRMESADGLFVVDGQQRVVSWSESAERVLGYRADEVVGRLCYEVMAGAKPNGHPICRPLCRVVANAQRGRVTRHFELIARNCHGDPVEAVNSIVLLKSGNGAQPWVLHLFHGAPSRLPIGRAGSGPGAAAEPPIPGRLSRREFEVLRLLAAGLGKHQIATTLSISPVTARNHINAIERKLGARSQLEAVALAVHDHLL